MKSLKLFVSVATVCLLVGASGTAMAVDCADGIIEGTVEEPLEVDEITIIGQNCLIHDVAVTGDIVVVNSENLGIVDSTVGGRVRVIGNRNATLVGVDVVGNITARNNEDANLALNVARNIRVINNHRAVVKKNLAAGIIRCRGNDRLDAFENEAGDVECRALGGGFGGPGPF